MIKQILKSLLLLLTLVSTTQAADSALFGGWAGLRPALEERGVTADAVLTSDFLYNTRGGNEEDGTILGNFDLTFAVDTAKAGWWENGTFFIYFLGNFNSNGPMTEITGDLQAASNIEADQTFKLYEIWYEHRFAAERLSLLLGLHDFNSEFDVLEYAGLFINSSFGISPDISQNGPSIFPSTALALRIKVQPTDTSYIMAAIYDGVPGDPDNPPRTAVILKKEDGVFAALELGITAGAADQADYYKLAVGGWLHTAEVENFNGQVHSYNRGFYLIGEKMLYDEGPDGQGLGGFIQFGIADDDLNQIASYWGAGLHYTGLFPGRDNDITGLAVAHANSGDEFLRYSETQLGKVVEHSETAIELSYRGELTPWLVLQPNAQYILNPNMDPAVDDALQVSVRMELTF